jgi:uncharacterized peroxidase-related enzyme
MSRLTVPARDDVPEASKPMLDAVNKQLGVVPNMFRLFAPSPAALAGLTSLDAANAKTLNLKIRTGVALAVAQVNGCGYCLSAHTYIGLNLAKISPEEALLNRQGKSGYAKTAAAVRFAARVAAARGQVSDTDLADVRNAGFSDAQMVEIVSVVAQNVLTNLINNVAQTDIDFPVVTADDLKTAA